MNDERNHEREPEEGIVISDKRHARDMEAEAAEETAQEPAPEPAPEPTSPPEPPAAEPTAPAEPAGEVVDFKPPERPAEPEPPAEQMPPPDPDSPEMMQVKMLFEMGLPGYLQGQLQLILNFAVIYLGRQANPATGLVSVDLDKARLAIDLFEFIIEHTKADLPEADYSGLLNVAKNLKMEYAEAAAGGGAAPSGTPEPGN